MVFFLSSGLFLGWSLGANHAGNVFGPAVGARMIKFRTAALLCSACVIAGAVLGGSGPANTLGGLGLITAPGGAFVTALATAVTITVMSRMGLPVSTSQAIVGAIVGWNAFARAPTAIRSLTTIAVTWVTAPCIAGVIAGCGYLLTRLWLQRSKMHLLTVDILTRVGLVLVSAFGAYSLGANNIGNVMGVFTSVTPFRQGSVFGLAIHADQQLFLLGGLAIAVGILTYSHRVVHTVGNDLLKLSPLAALVVLTAHGLVLFLFSSQELSRLLSHLGIPQIPMVPVSSSQAITGAILGIGLAKHARGLRVRVLREITMAWVAAPVVAGLACYVLLFVAQNVFELQVKTSERHGAAYSVTMPRSVQNARHSLVGVPMERHEAPKSECRPAATGFEVSSSRVLAAAGVRVASPVSQVALSGTVAADARYDARDGLHGPS